LEEGGKIPIQGFFPAFVSDFVEGPITVFATTASCDMIKAMESSKGFEGQVYGLISSFRCGGIGGQDLAVFTQFGSYLIAAFLRPTDGDDFSSSFCTGFCGTSSDAGGSSYNNDDFAF
jgi:hypothetical protein